MSGQVIKEFLVSLGLEVDGETKFDSSVRNATLVVAGLGAAVVTAATGMFAFTKSIAESFDSLSDSAIRIDTTASALDKLGYQASLTDSSLEDVQSSLERLNRVAGDTFMGTGEGVKVFESLGLSVKDSNGELKDSTVLLGQVGEKIKGMERGQQVAIMERLGISSTLLTMLTSDMSAFAEEYDKVYEAVGLNVDEAASKSSDFMDAFGRLGFVLGSVGKSLAVNFMGKFTQSMNMFRVMMVDNLPKIMAVLKPIIAMILTVADVIIAMAYRGGQALGVVIGWFTTLHDATGGLSTGILAVAAAWKYLNAGFLLTPVGMILALVAAIGLLIDDFLTWKEGGDSLINWAAWEGEINAAMAVVNFFKAQLESLFGMIFGSVDALVKLFTGDFAGAWLAIGLAIDSFMQGASRAVDAIKSLGDFVFGGSAPAPGAAITPAPGAAITPSPSTGAAMTAGGQNVSQETNIIVNGAGDPKSVAGAVEQNQSRVNGDMVRNMKGAAT